MLRCSTAMASLQRKIEIQIVLWFASYIPLVYQLAVELPHEVATAAGLECGEHNAHLHVSLVLEFSQHSSFEEHLCIAHTTQQVVRIPIPTQQQILVGLSVLWSIYSFSLTLLFPRRYSLVSSCRASRRSSHAFRPSMKPAGIALGARMTYLHRKCDRGWRERKCTCFYDNKTM